MSAEAIDLRLTIGASVYKLTAVGDPNDALFAFNVGRGISEALLAHAQQAEVAQR